MEKSQRVSKYLDTQKETNEKKPESCVIDKRVAYCGERSLLMEKFSRRLQLLI
jgi:hypothetical protein